MAEEYNRDNINPTQEAVFTGDEGILRDISHGEASPSDNFDPEKDYPTPVKLEKNIFGLQKAKENLDVDFSELSYKQFSVSDFFKIYKQLFYEIPKKGFFSHKKIVDTSLDYIKEYDHPKNKDIDNMYFQLKTAAEQFHSIENTNSIIPNSTIVQERGTDVYYYIHSFKKRKIYTNSSNNLLDKIKEYKVFPRNADIVIPLSKEALDEIKNGLPIRSIDDIKISTLKINLGISEFSIQSLINKYGSINLVTEDGELINHNREIDTTGQTGNIGSTNNSTPNSNSSGRPTTNY